MEESKVEIRKIEASDLEFVTHILIKSWNSVEVVSKGKIHDASKLKGFIAIVDNKPCGLTTFDINKNECELVTLDSILEGHGAGFALVREVIEHAKSQNCRRLWTVTTNDNAHAQEFYKKLGFRYVTTYPNAVSHSRILKPSIPLVGINNVPITDEIEFELNIF